MAMYKGKTKTGRLYSILYQYFLSKPIGMQFQRRDVGRDLMKLYTKMYPDQQQYTDSTAFMDAIITLTRYGGPFRYVSPTNKRTYELFRKFRPLLDDKVLQQNYFKIDKKGVKYREKMKKQRKTNMHTAQDNISELKHLGSAKTEYIYNNPNIELLETFENKYPSRKYITEFIFTEFTSLCPKTGQPDFATIKIQYIPGKRCIETKSLKLYFLSFRQYGSFMETITNKILEDCCFICNPQWMKVTSNFNARGGTLINVEAEYNETN